MKMTIIHNDGLYRTIRFESDGLAFHIITVSGYLTFLGECCYTFGAGEDSMANLESMELGVAAAGLVSVSCNGDTYHGSAKYYDIDKLKRQIQKRFLNPLQAQLSNKEFDEVRSGVEDYLGHAQEYGPDQMPSIIPFDTTSGETYILKIDLYDCEEYTPEFVKAHALMIEGIKMYRESHER